MKNIHLVTLEKYNNSSQFEKIADGIYKALYPYENKTVEPGHYVTTLSFTLEEERKELQDRQYPLEDILDKFLAHVATFVQDEKENPVMILELCTQGWLTEMKELVQLAGKQVYNREVLYEGETCYELVIE